jgi:hypothetical protein
MGTQAMNGLFFVLNQMQLSPAEKPTSKKLKENSSLSPFEPFAIRF